MPIENNPRPPDDPESLPWEQITDVTKFRSPQWREWILKDLSVYEPGTRTVDQERREKVHDKLRQYGLMGNDEGTETPLDRLRQLQSLLNEQLIEKSEIIKMVIVAAIAQQPLLLIGAPGTAKSKIITRFCEGLGMARIGENPKEGETWFHYLLHSFTEPDELLGPVNIGKLQKDGEFRRLRHGSITDADVIFLDEVFKANSAILNALLTIINERRVFEGGQAEKTRARLIYGASNAIPTPRQMEELRAFYERFILRLQSEMIPVERRDKVDDRRDRLIKQGWRSEVADMRAGFDPAEAAIEQVSCLNDILFCNRMITELWGAENLDSMDSMKDFLQHYHGLVEALDKDANGLPVCKIDDRKFVKMMSVVRAHALFSHSGPPQVADLEVFKHIWDDLNYEHMLKVTVETYIKNRSTDAGRR